MMFRASRVLPLIVVFLFALKGGLVPHAGAQVVEVCFDARGEEHFERSLSAIVRLALTAIELDQPILLRTQAISEAFGSGREPMLELWKWLAIASPLPLDAPAPPKATAHDAVHLPAALNRLGSSRPPENR